VSRDARAAGPGRWAPGLAWPLFAYELTYVAALVGTAAVGAVLATRRPRHPLPGRMLALGLSVTVDGVTDNYARYGLLAAPGAVPAVGHLRGLGDTFGLWPACIGFILLLTPTGSLPSPRWRWWAWIAVVAPLTAFVARLREQVDLDTLRAELLALVDHTMQPARTSIWLRPPATPERPR
jgi:hypothetical protein